MPCCAPAIRFWVDTVLEMVRRDHTDSFGPGNQRGPFLTARAQGLALAALYDAGVDDETAALDQGRLLKLPAIANPPNPDNVLARAAACHQLLLLRYPAQTDDLNIAWQTFGGLFPSAASPAAQAASERHGRRHGTELHLLGLNDRTIAAATAFAQGGDYWHGAPPNEPGQLPAGPTWGTQASLLVTERVNGLPSPPGRVDALNVVPSAHFDQDFAKVRVKGAAAAGTRSPNEELIGIFWGYDGPQEVGTPPRLYLQVALTVLDELQSRQPDKLDEEQALRLLAAIALTMSDAGVEAWRYKYSPDHMMWRPARGIPAGLEGSGSPGVAGWLPLGRPDTNGQDQNRTPNFPAYPSGHATFGAAAFQLLRLVLVHQCGFVFGKDGLDNVRFCCSSDEYNGRNRDPRPPRSPRPRMSIMYDSLWAALIDNSVSRVYLGVHWQFDGVTVHSTSEPEGAFGIPVAPAQLGRRGGVWLGCQLANQVAKERMGVPADVVAASMSAG